MRTTTIAVVVMVAVVGLLTVQAAAGWTEQQKITASPDAGNADWFGNSVSISGDYAIVGARRDDDAGNSSGSAYIFKRDGTTWTQQAKLTAGDAASSDYFGGSVSISGDYAIVGARQNDHPNNSGSAYIFKRDGTTWSQQAKLTASDATASDYFGGSVSISGDYAIIGADHTTTDDYGSAYVFKRNDTNWTQRAKLTASDATDDAFFGRSVSISGGYAVIGAYNDDNGVNNAGSAYIFKRPDSGWADATQTAKLTASDAESSDYFGGSVSISGDCALVGAYGVGTGGSGKAYIFEKPDSGWADTTQTAELTADDAATGDHFGISVSIDDDSVVVGAYRDGGVGNYRGSAYIFEKPGTGWADMTETVKLTASDAGAGDEFGYSVSIDDGSVLVGAYKEDHAGSGSGEFDRGSAYVYVPEPATLSLLAMGAVAMLRRRRRRS